MPGRFVYAFFALTLALRAQAPISEPLEALANAAATFASTAPGLMAEETLDQRGRRGFIDIIKGTIEKPKLLDIRLPDDFHIHHVVSSYGFTRMGEGRVLHELRNIISIDGEDISDPGDARHALTVGILAADDRTKRKLLENFEHEQLEGAVTDFGQLILLFAAHSQSNYQFSYGEPGILGDGPAVVLVYRQIAGDQGLTVFDDRTEVRQKTEGQIWLRESDLLPLRITMNTERMVTKKDAVRTEATVDYEPSPFGLVPSSVVQKQFLNADLLVENNLRYADFKRPGLRGIIP